MGELDNARHGWRGVGVDRFGGAEIQRELAAFWRRIHRQNARPHGGAELRRGEPDGTLTEDRQRVAPRDVESFQSGVGGARAAGNRGAFWKRQLVGKWRKRRSWSE